MIKINDKVEVVNGPFKGKKGIISRLHDFNVPDLKPKFVVVFDNPYVNDMFIPECFFDPDKNDLALIDESNTSNNYQFSEEELNLLRNIISHYENALNMFSDIAAIDNCKKLIFNLKNRITNLPLKRAM